MKLFISISLASSLLLGGLQAQQSSTALVTPSIEVTSESQPSQKVIGIMGGMGPGATVDAQAKLLQALIDKGAKKDQDYPNIMVSIASQTPDRTGYLNDPEHAKSPVPSMIQSLKNLERAGAGTIFITCNTAHAFYDSIAVAKHPNTKLLSMTKLAAESVKDVDPSKVLLLATDGTLNVGVYHKQLGNDILSPEVGSKTQEIVMDIIYGKHGIKAGYTAKDSRLKEKQTPWYKLQKVLKKFPTAEKVILGCTELPLAVGEPDGDKFIDPAAVVIEEALISSGALKNIGN